MKAPTRKFLAIAVVVTAILIAISLILPFTFDMFPNASKQLTQGKQVTPTPPPPTSTPIPVILPPMPQGYQQGKWSLLWRDEFSGAAQSRPDAGKWNVATKYVDGMGYASIRNVHLDGNGNLVVEIKKENPDQMSCDTGPCEFTGGSLNTDRKFEIQPGTYGRIEVRARLPQGQGIRTALILRGKNWLEVGWPASGSLGVIEALGKSPAEVYASCQGTGYSNNKGFYKTYKLPNGTFSDDFHIFATEWSKDSVSYFIDGNLYYTLKRSDVEKRGKWVFDSPLIVTLDLTVGQDWIGGPDAATKFPQQFAIDYMRAFTFDPAQGS